MRGLLVVITGLLWLAPGAVLADPTIRVLMAAATQQVTVSASGGLLVETGDERLSRTSPLTIAAGQDGALLDGARRPARRLRIASRTGEDLVVALAEGSPSVAVTAMPPEGPASLRLPGVLDVLVGPGGLQLVNEVGLEAYVGGVVPYEMNAGWPMEALKAQAVAARTYALYQQRLNAGREYDVVAGVQDQVYRGRHPDPRGQEAASATRGLVLVYQGEPILAVYSSTAAGPTEDAAVVWAKDLPYLKGVDCPFDATSPYYRWRAAFTLDDLEAGLARLGLPVGPIATLAPLRYSRSGRVAAVRLLHAGGETILRGEELRRALGYSVVPSTSFEIESVGREVILTGRGAGHAVGMCQWGAKELATLGYPFSTILSYYFPGAELASLAAP